MTASAGRGKPPPRPSEDPAFPTATVLEALAQIIASRAFRASARRKRLLSFLVEETLAGRADRLKPYAIAVDGLGCDETFNPQIDPLVRLEVGRLRRDLEHYYLTDGRADSLRITIPKGGSVPVFERREVQPEATLQARGDAPGYDAFTARRRGWLAPGAVLLTLTLGLIGAFCFSPGAATIGPPVGARGGARSAGDAARGRRR